MSSAAERRKALVDVALGRRAPDLVLTGGRVANVMTREIHAAEIAIHAGRIASVTAPGEVAWPEATKKIDLAGAIVAPGFIDPHVHIESSMVSVSEYSRVAIACGVTCVAADPHEIGNVLGMPGMKLLFDAAKCVPLRVLLRVPGRIPAMPDWLETSNGMLDVEGVSEMLRWPEAVCLAGDISPSLLLGNDDEQAQKIALAAAAGFTISGQSPGLRGRALSAFAAAGPEDSHVANNVQEIIENQRQGLHSLITLRPGRRLDRSHLRELAMLIREGNIETRYLEFCSDDIHAHNLLSEGHIDHRMRVAIEEGFDPMVALQMGTINVAEGLRIDRDFGSITPGKFADLQVLDDLRTAKPRMVFIDGELAFADGKPICSEEAFSYPEWSRKTVRLPRPVTASDMGIRLARLNGSAKVRAITAATPKEQVEVELLISDGVVLPEAAQNVSSIAVVDRHKASGGIGRGFVSGLSLARGAIATTVSHDAHNIVVIGADHADMALAANRIADIGGGYVVAAEGKVLFELPLPIAGLMSDRPIAEVAALTQKLEELLLGELGCTFPTRPIMTLNFLCLPNIPKFGFTDKGLVSAHHLALVDALVGEHDG